MNANRTMSPSPRIGSPAIATITTQALNAPVFVPKFTVATASTPAESDTTSPVLQSQNDDSKSTTVEEIQYQYEHENDYQDQGEGGYVEDQSYEQEHQQYGQQDYARYQGYDYQVDQAGNALQGMELVRAPLWNRAAYIYVIPEDGPKLLRRIPPARHDGRVILQRCPGVPPSACKFSPSLPGILHL